MMKRILYIVFVLTVLVACENKFPTWEEYNTVWLEDNKSNLKQMPEVDTTFVLPTGVQCEVFHKGFGPKPKATVDPMTGRSSLLKVEYKGMLPDGVVFDQTDSVPAQIYLGDCIKGWQQSLTRVRQGADVKIYIPASEGYGELGTKDAYGNYVVPPHSTLIFEVKLLEVTNY